MPQPEAGSTQSPKDILKAIDSSIKKISPKSRASEQEVGAVLAGVTQLSQAIDLSLPKCKPYLDLLKSKLANPSVAGLPKALVDRMDKQAKAADPNLEAIEKDLELARNLEVGKNPALDSRLKGISAKLEQLKQPPAPEDFIPIASDVEEETEETPGENILLVGLREVIRYLPDNNVNKDLVIRANSGDPRAISQLVDFAVKRQYSDRMFNRLTRFIAREPARTGEAVLLLEALSVSDPQNPEVHQLLGDAYLKLGRHKEAINAYRTKLQLPPKSNGT